MKSKKPLPGSIVDLTADGEQVPMVPFVERILADTVMAMVRTLYGCENAEYIELAIRPRSASENTEL